MPLTVERNETRWLIRLAGEFNLSAASELKSLLLEALASTKELQLDLSAAEQIDITLLQLLDAAGREARWQGAALVGAVSEPAARAARDLGFERFPGDSGVNHG